MDNGGPAFPTWAATDSNQGMTLRDYFAAKAMSALIASQVRNQDHGFTEPAYALGFNAPGGASEGDDEALVEDAYRISDAMLKARVT